MAKASSEITVAVGQRVNYVMTDGSFRPLDVVLFEKGEVSGYVLLGPNDQDLFPVAFLATEVTVSFSPHISHPVPTWICGVTHDDTRTPGTFHFGEEEDAGEGFDKAVLQEQIDDLRKQIKALTPKKEKTAKPAKVTEMPTPA